MNKEVLEKKKQNNQILVTIINILNFLFKKIQKSLTIILIKLYIIIIIKKSLYYQLFLIFEKLISILTTFVLVINNKKVLFKSLIYIYYLI